MPYKPTGKPPGRPRKSAPPVASLPAGVAPEPRKSLPRLRAGYRRAADLAAGLATPDEYDSRRRPRRPDPKSKSRHQHIGLSANA